MVIGLGFVLCLSLILKYLTPQLQEILKIYLLDIMLLFPFTGSGITDYWHFYYTSGNATKMTRKTRTFIPACWKIMYL